MSRKVIYTSLTGNYDCLSQPLVKADDFDYICFSNDIKEKKIGVWEIAPIPYKNNDMMRLSRYVKIMPQEVLANYDYSLYIDANIQITSSYFYEIVNQRISEGGTIYQVPHPQYDCIYDDIRKAYLGRRVSLKDAKKQFGHLLEKGFPQHYGLYENGLMLRKHNDEFVVRLSKKWWDEYLSFSKRDQFSLAYVYWTEGFRPGFLFDETHGIRNVDCLNYINHPNCQSFFRRNIVTKTTISNIRTAIRLLMIKLYLQNK